MEVFDQGLTCRIIADHGNRQNARAEVGQIVDCVGTAAGKKLRFTVAEYEDGRLAGNARDFSRLILIGHKVPEDNDLPVHKMFDESDQRREIYRCRSRLDGPQMFLHRGDRKSTRLNSSHGYISYAVFCLKKKID